jgi:[ribosomal protein S5]-alanine N-acetyltransferase
MGGRSTLITTRLLLRPFSTADAEAVQNLAGDSEVAAATLTIPHPYPIEAALTWISSHEAESLEGRGETFAVIRRSDSRLVGGIGLSYRSKHRRAELGYWIGRPFWRQGFATESVQSVLQFAFATLGANRVFAAVIEGNVASGRVLRKAGMTLEGVLRQHVLKDGMYRSLEHYGIVADEYRSADRAEVR